jgi:hypothetical protein
VVSDAAAVEIIAGHVDVAPTIAEWRTAGGADWQGRS